MVGFSDTATVTFVPFFAVPPTAPAPTTATPRGGVGNSGNVEQAGSDRVGSDRVVALRVAHALAELHVPILRTLEVSVREGHVTLRGRVRSYYERQLAHTHAKRTAGVVKVSEEITIAG